MAITAATKMKAVRLARAGPMAAVLAVTAFIAAAKLSDATPDKLGAAAVATYFSAVGIIAGTIGRSGRHVSHGLVGGVVAAIAWWGVYVGAAPAIGVVAVWLAATVAWAVFGAILGAADPFEHHWIHGGVAGIIAAVTTTALLLPGTVVAAVPVLIACHVVELSGWPVRAAVFGGGCGVASYWSWKLYFVTVEEPPHILRLKAAEMAARSPDGPPDEAYKAARHGGEDFSVAPPRGDEEPEEDDPPGEKSGDGE